jgi:hypothetical protein
MRGPVSLPRIGLVLSLSLLPSDSRAQENLGSCARCHRIIDEARLSNPVRDYVDDVHYARGFGCTACHGGSSATPGRAAKAPGTGFVGAPARSEIPELCGRCHSDGLFMRRFNPSPRIDQVAEYRTSVHGQRLFGLGDQRVATCTSCHPAHSIRPPSDPESSVHPPRVAETCGGCHADPEHMRGYGIPTDQLAEYRRSVHWRAMDEGGDLSAPTCNDCHGNHGAAPPEVESVGNVCGQCHTAQQELFAASAHAAAFVELGRPGCAGCHDNHAIRETSDEMLALGPDAVCGECHTAAEWEGKTAVAMHGYIELMKRQRERADSLLVRAEEAGLEVSQAKFELEDATNAIVRARSSTHSASLDSVRTRVEDGLKITDEAQERGRSAFRDLHIRRLGLGVSSFIIVLLIAGLVMKIREVEGKKSRDEDPPAGGGTHG